MTKASLIILLTTISICISAQEEYCCWRTLIFPPFEMPEEQEGDYSGQIASGWESNIHKLGAEYLGECPLKIEVLSYSGVNDRNQIIEAITAVTTGQPIPNPSDYQDLKKNVDYIWKGILELTYIEKIIPGRTEPSYEGGTEYIPGYVVGGWKFTIQLYDIQHEEIVKEASTTWTGTPLGFQINLMNEYLSGKSDKIKIDILEELFNREFHDLKRILIDYERAPKKAEFESEIIKVDPDQTKRITFKVTDSKGEVPKKWQRLAVKVDFGSLINGTPCCEIGEESKFYSFMCEEGEVTIEYKAPDSNKSTSDHITVYNGCITNDPAVIQMTMVDTQEEIGAADIAFLNEGYSGTITITKSWDYKRNYDDYSETYIGTQTITYSGIFKPLPQMEGMEGQPIKMFGKSSVRGTWKHNEQRYCEGGSGCGNCKGLVYEEYGSGSIPEETLQGLIIITNVWPTDNKVVADQLGQFGLANWYDIATPTETVPTQTRTKHETENAGCQWYNSTSTTVLTSSEVRFKLKDIKNIAGKSNWSSLTESSGIRITDMTEAIYDQEPFEPEQNGNDYTYSITWTLKTL